MLQSSFPRVSVIIAAANEARNIQKRIENLKEQEYPEDRIEIIVASDGSTDETVALASAYSGVVVLDFPTRRGRALVHNESVRHATGDIVVFSDAETLFDKAFLKNATAYFSDPQYKCGAGNYFFHASESIGQTEDTYWRMEKAMREQEYQLGVLPFASGGCLLFQRSLFEPISSHSDVDNILPLLVIEKGYKIFYAADAKAFDVTVDSVPQYFKKRLRTAQRSFTDIASRLRFLVRAGRLSVVWVLVSHRIIRWFTGYLLFLIAVSTVVGLYVQSDQIWQFLGGAQGGFYTAAALGWFIKNKTAGPQTVFTRGCVAVYSFVLAAVAFSIAIYRMCCGEKIQTYTTINSTSQ